MKLIYLFILNLILSSFSFGKDVPDILVYSKLENRWNVFLLNEFQQVMDNFSVDVNPKTFVSNSGPIIYDDSTISEFLTVDAATLIKKIQEAAKLDILNLKPEVVINRLGYSLEKIYPKAYPVQNKDGNITLNSELTLSGIQVYADDIELNLVLNDLDGKTRQVLKLYVTEPVVSIDPSKFINFKFDLTFEETKEDLKLKFDRGDFSDIIQFIKKNPDSIKMDYKNIVIPKVELKLMGRTITINSEKIKEAIDYNREDIEKILLEQFSSIIEKDGAMALLKKLENYTFSKTRWFNTTSRSSSILKLKIEKFFAVAKKPILGVELSGDFCTPFTFGSYGEDCVNQKEVKVVDNLTTKKDTSASKKVIEKLLTDKDTKFVASLSENYINNIIAHTIEMGFWNDTFQQLGIALGENGISVRMNKKGNTGSVYVDAVKDVGGFTGALLKERYVHFPVVLDVNIKVEYRDSKTRLKTLDNIYVTTKEPFLIMTVSGVDLTDATLLNGVPKYGLESNLKDVRKIFKKKVLKTIRKELQTYASPGPDGVELPGLLFPELSNLGLDKAEVESDGLGRINIILKESEVRGLH